MEFYMNDKASMRMKNQNESFEYKCICSIISNNIGNRKLALRWKNRRVEEAIYEQCGLKVDKYFSLDKSRCQEEDTIHQTELYGKSDEYYAVILLNWNLNDYKQMFGGYEEYRDFIFLGPKPEIFTSGPDGKQYEDYFGNKLYTMSPISIRFRGYNASVHIGRNVKLPHNLVIDIRENCLLNIEDESIINTDQFKMGKGTTFSIGKKVSMYGLYIFINELSSVEIGSNCSFQTGKLRTGRNQRIVVGEDCMFSWDIVFLPHDGHLIYSIKEDCFINNTVGKRRDSIEIGSHCWIGGETVIMPNTYVGSGSVLGYRCMAKGKYPNNCVIVGQPGRVVRKDIAWMRSNVSYDPDDILLLDEKYRKITEDD